MISRRESDAVEAGIREFGWPMTPPPFDEVAAAREQLPGAKAKLEKERAAAADIERQRREFGICAPSLIDLYNALCSVSRAETEVARLTGIVVAQAARELRETLVNLDRLRAGLVGDLPEEVESEWRNLQARAEQLAKEFAA